MEIRVLNFKIQDSLFSESEKRSKELIQFENKKKFKELDKISGRINITIHIRLILYNKIEIDCILNWIIQLRLLRMQSIILNLKKLSQKIVKVNNDLKSISFLSNGS